MNLRQLYYHFSPELRLALRKIYFFPEDLFRSITGRKQKLEPDKGEIYIGSGDFLQQGESQVKLLKELINLQKTDSVLDIGSGIGRTAIPLSRFLTGKYEGFDVVKKGVDWCNRNIKSKFPNFNFTFVPLHNDLYNSFKEEAEVFVFPYADKSFDKAFLFSVFTHMGISEIQNYLKQIKRVLKNDGKCLATFFIYSDEDEETIANLDGFSFPHKFDRYRLMNRKVQHANIAVHRELLFEMIENAGLTVEKIEDGHWKTDSKLYSEQYFQDIVIIKP